MKKYILIGLIGILLLSSQAIIGAASTQKQEGHNRSSEWVIMVYLNGDNALSAAQAAVLQELKQVGSTSDVQLTILIDQNQVGDTKLYYIEGTTLVQQTWPSESNMDDATTIKDFVVKVKSDFPANHYELLISSNKGSAWQGICWDDHGDGIMITMPELLDALNQITNNGTEKLDIVGIETCMTGNTEVAYQIHNCVDIFIAYPECAMAGDWPYSEPLIDLIADPTMTPDELAITTVEYFVPFNYPQYNMITTMAATKLSYLDGLAAQLNDLAVWLKDNLDQYKNQITSAVESSRVYALSWNIDYYIDLYDFLDYCTMSDSDFITIKNNIQDNLDTAVIANKHLASDPAHGLSIYFPRRAGDYNDCLRYDELPSPYEATLFAIDTQWDEFLKTYLGITNNTAPNTPTITGPATGKPDVTYDFTCNSADPEGHDIFYYIDWNDGSNSGWMGPYSSNSDLVVNHTWSEKGTYAVKIKAKDIIGAESAWGTLSVKIPASIPIDESTRTILIGTISNLEKNEQGGFRFLPRTVMYFSKTTKQLPAMKILKETNGEYPCCCFIPLTEYKGWVTEKFIIGIWTTHF
jgi:uncharacterized protein YozE (UPF0346 family)